MKKDQIEKEMAKLQKEALEQITNEISKLDMYLPCQDGTGEIYNRNTGQRYNIAKTGNKVSGDAKDPIKVIGSYYTEDRIQSMVKTKLGEFSDY